MEFKDILKTLGSIPLEIGKMIAKDPLGFVANELLGVDDFRRAARYTGQGDFLKALKSLGAGTFELGSTILPAGTLLKGTKIAPAAIKGLGFAEDAMLPAMKSNILPATRTIRGREIPRVSTALLSRIPGATQVVGSNVATRAPLRALTPMGRRGLQAYRAGETAQWLDLGNALAAGVGAPSISALPGARMVTQQQQAAAANDVLSRMVQAYQPAPQTLSEEDLLTILSLLSEQGAI